MIWKESDTHKTKVSQVLTIFTEVSCILEADLEAGPLRWKVRVQIKASCVLIST